MLRSHEKILSRYKVLKLWKKNFFSMFFHFSSKKILFFYAKKMCTNFCRTIKIFSENNALESFFKQILWIVFKREFFLIKNSKQFFFQSFRTLYLLIFFHGTEAWGKVLLKVLFLEKQFTKFQTWKKKFFEFFPKDSQLKKFHET